MIKDTIAAIATAMSSSGIGIVRMSGPDSFEIIDKIFNPKKAGKKLSNEKGYSLHYGFIKDGEDLIDEVLVLAMRGPHSYTAEDTIEIDCHGGVYVVKKILETVIKYGARVADPGEFTKRAFLNGRIDLSQAEAVIDVINAKNEMALKSSLSQLKGSVHTKIVSLREDILYEIAFIESALDDPEHISLDEYPDTLLPKVQKINQDLKKLLASCDNGKFLKEGIQTVIVGKPNVGKSSLMNVLVGEERAIVTDIAGTTRDIIEEHISLNGVSLNIIDTAGIRNTEDIVENIGVSKAKDYAEKADLILYVVDGTKEMDEADEEIWPILENKKVIILLNKSDLDNILTKEQLEERFDFPVISISAKEETGITILEDTLKEMFFQGELSFNDEIYITNMRHKEAIQNAYDSMQLVEGSILDGMPEDFFSIDLMNAYKALGIVIGEEIEDDLANEIFSKFCMGK